MSAADSFADALTLRSSDGSTEATVHPSANLVCSELNYAGSQWLDPVRTAEAKPAGKSFGVSLVHPWAGRLAGFEYSSSGQRVKLSSGSPLLPLDKQGLPIHGVWGKFLSWDVEDQRADRVVARLDWRDEDLLGVFPFPHQLRSTISVQPGALRVENELHAVGSAAVPVVFGYHVFLCPPDSSRERWSVSLPEHELLVLDSSSIPTGERAPGLPAQATLGSSSFDADLGGLAAKSSFAVADPDASVQVVLDEGFGYCHFFAPVEKNLVSLEPMTAPANALRSGSGLRLVEPGAVYRTSFTISVTA